MMKRIVFLFILCVVFAARGALCEVSAGTVASAKSISMDLEDTALTQVLRVFSQVSGLNFVVSDEIASKKITVYFDNVLIKDALDSLIKTNVLRY